ncbi:MULTISPECIES: ABC transporter substrate-binding protein [Aminobacterium]|jgi:iron(III) transport system substrate-binding protein|uniref:Extracellular solute-binding protein family 1 n=1 Tax=Aminobacterium colombiense (strain DSM 12261 / ALA-1) TaxID=572547 RepID=D5EGL1_AMICL|nr:MULTISPECIES: ABC transporter substrate-binding protein [Aminobacterium]MDD2378560.1 ABC transporter substrate-binding protein [Aminobacterium colombiense]ADE57693.1 extracellular solute-binding protein family 1 [Aminobacterium colombiense DSM 12261]MDD3768391.1 ABC transporter substrate-binding protein [Aminobacterium colombiense]MDD4265288.1 ABC transporter substrate-binding protein [Aminobacterium colombiense]MDD4585296.1 ABC transporter substrate-binding protein [Aminobacterium colombie
MKNRIQIFTVFAVVLAMLCMVPFRVFAGDLIVYSSVDEENARHILEAFTKETGIKVQMVFLSSGPALSRIEAEKANPQADVWFGAPSENHIVARERGLTEPYVSSEESRLAANFKDPEGYWHAFYMNPIGIGVLPDELAAEKIPVPQSWEDLKHEGLKGMIQMPSPQSSGTAFAIMMTLISIYGEDEAYAYMKALNPNIQTYTQSGTGPSKNLAIKEAKVAIQFTPAFLKLVDEGFPATVIFPKEGVGYEAAALSIIKGVKNKEEAHKLVDWILSKKGQESLSENKTYFFPVRSDVSAGEGLPPLSEIKLINYDIEKAAQEKSRLIDRWVTEVLGQ